MSDTLPDVEVDDTAFVDINTTTGIAVGTALIIDNKSNYPVLLQVSATQPSATSEDGVLLAPFPNENSVKSVLAGGNTIWARCYRQGVAKLSVQDV